MALQLEMESFINMVRRVFLNEGGTGYTSGRITIPKAYIELLGITKEDDKVEVIFKDGKIIIEKVNK